MGSLVLNISCIEVEFCGVCSVWRGKGVPCVYILYTYDGWMDEEGGKRDMYVYVQRRRRRRRRRHRLRGMGVGMGTPPPRLCEAGKVVAYELDQALGFAER